MKRLVARADAVVENYAREVAPKLGLGYAALRAEKADIVMVSMPAFRAGPWEQARAYGFTLEQASGLPSIAGNPDGPPLLTHYAYGDPIGGLNATAALLTALAHRQATGEGQHIDISQVECMFPMAAPWMIEQSVTGKLGPRLGNRHPRNAPQNVFRYTTGPIDFVHISVTDDAMWRRLCIAIGRPDFADNPALATVAGRRTREAEIEAAIEAWTATRDADEVMYRLQSRKVVAGVVRSPCRPRGRPASGRARFPGSRLNARFPDRMFSPRWPSEKTAAHTRSAMPRRQWANSIATCWAISSGFPR